MKFRKLGNTQIDISLICLGSMTWGEQNTQDEAFEQIDYSLERGVNFIDTAEMYAVPPREETYGLTETMIGNWIHKTKRRDEIILASKVTGRADRFPYVRPELNKDGITRLDRANIIAACEASLKRLKTDHIDLYQLHWPDRSTNFFGPFGYQHNEQDDSIDLLETLEALNELVTQGKVSYIGLSNETPWGFMRFLELSKTLDLPRVMCVQNPYNLVNRHYEAGMAEISCRENAGLLAYSPLAMGTLSGKYLGGKRPAGSRMALFGQYFPRYTHPRVEKVIQQYLDIANKHGLDPSLMANAFVNQQVFVSSNIIGARTMDQLKLAIDSADVHLSEEIMSEIEAVHIENPYPVGK